MSLVLDNTGTVAIYGADKNETDGHGGESLDELSLHILLDVTFNWTFCLLASFTYLDGNMFPGANYVVSWRDVVCLQVIPGNSAGMIEALEAVRVVRLNWHGKWSPHHLCTQAAVYLAEFYFFHFLNNGCFTLLIFVESSCRDSNCFYHFGAAFYQFGIQDSVGRLLEFFSKWLDARLTRRKTSTNCFCSCLQHCILYVPLLNIWWAVLLRLMHCL